MATDWQQVFDEGRMELAAGRIAKAHRLFADVAEHEPDLAFLGHALAVSLPNSFVVKVDRQIEPHNAAICRQALVELHYQYLEVRLFLLDVQAVSYLTSPGIEVLTEMQKWPEVSVKLLNVHPRPAQILKLLGMHEMIWDDYSCPVCGPQKSCPAKFARRRRHVLPLPR